MARKFGSKNKKGPFDSLPSEFKDAVAAEDLAAIKARLSDIAKAEEANQAAKAADEDLNKLKEQAKYAGVGYREGTKMNKTKVKFIISVLADKGDETALQIVRLNLIAAGLKGF